MHLWDSHVVNMLAETSHIELCGSEFGPRPGCSAGHVASSHDVIRDVEFGSSTGCLAEWSNAVACYMFEAW